MFKAIIMEVKEDYIIVMKEGGSLVKINKKGDLKVGQSIYCFEDDLYIEKVVNKRKSFTSYIVPLGVVAALLCVLCLPMIKNTSPISNNDYAILTFDVNPSIEFNLDEDGKIINVSGINDDSNKLNIDNLKGISLKEGASKLRDILSNENYLGNKNSVLVGFSFIGKNDNASYEKMVQTTVKDTFTGTNVAFMKGNEDAIKKAKEQGISIGKYEAIAKLDEDGIEEAFENLSTQELLDLLKANNSNVFLNEDALDELEDEIEDRVEGDEDDDFDEDDHDDDDEDSDD